MVSAVAAGRTWIKASGPHRLGEGAVEVLRMLVQEVGHERVVWASDCPFVGEESRISYAQTLAWLKEALPDSATQRRVMSDNAIALYGFGDAR